MKRTFAIMMLGAMASLAMAGQKTVIEAIVPAPLPAPAPAPAPACDSNVGLEFAGVVGIADRHILKGYDRYHGSRVNTYGGDVTAVYNVDKSNALTLRFGLVDGASSYTHFEGYKDRYKVLNTSLMPGYRFTTPLCDSTSLFFGANIGWLHQNVRQADYALYDGKAERLSSTRASSDGFAYSAEVGLRFDVTEAMNLFVAYTFSGSNAKSKLYEGADRTRAQIYHNIRAGVGFTF